jgi:hypothetical protein
LFSFQNIAANNGWAMAFAGALIVMSGLTVLSFIISQLHRIVGMVEKKAAPEPAPDTEPEAIPKQFPDSLDQVADLYAPLVKELPEDFGLEELFALTRAKDFPHPHLTIRAFREAGVLVAKGEGKFSWNA